MNLAGAEHANLTTGLETSLGKAGVKHIGAQDCPTQGRSLTDASRAFAKEEHSHRCVAFLISYFVLVDVSELDFKDNTYCLDCSLNRSPVLPQYIISLHHPKWPNRLALVYETSSECLLFLYDHLVALPIMMSSDDSELQQLGIVPVISTVNVGVVRNVYMQCNSDGKTRR